MPIYERDLPYLLNRPKSDGELVASELSKYEDLVNTISGINYIIDPQYRITFYSLEKWNEFAKLNDGENLLKPNSIKGQSVLNFFDGSKVREHYKRIYDHIFEKRREEIMIKSKCDAPEVLRDNVLYLTPIYDDIMKKNTVIGILHQSLIISEKERQNVPLIKRKDEATVPEGKFLEICSICKFVYYETEDNFGWINPEDYYKYGGNDDIKLEHSICDDCEIMLDEFF